MFDAGERLQEAKRIPIEAFFNGVQGLVALFTCGYIVLGFSVDASSCVVASNETIQVPVEVTGTMPDDFVDLAERWRMFLIVMMVAGGVEILLTALVLLKATQISDMKNLA